MRVVTRAITLLLLVSALTLLADTGALAATPTPSPVAGSKVVVYTGVGYYTNSINPAFVQNALQPPSAATVDCSGSPCTIVVKGTDPSTAAVLTISGARPLPLVNGRASAHVDGPSNALCFNDVVTPGELSATATGDTITIAYAFDHQPDQTCPDGSQVAFVDGYVYHAVLTAPAGTGCLATGTCIAAAAPSASPTVMPAATGPRRAAPQPIRITDPSTLSTLSTVGTAFSAPNTIWAVTATVVLALLIAFPSHLLNSATEAGTDRVSEWWAARRARLRALGAATSGTETSPPPAKAVDLSGWPLAAAGVLAASLISSFVDPNFGFNAASVRVFLSILTSFLLDAVAGWFLLILFVRRATPSATARFHFAPASLLIVVVAVLFTRITGFAPGIVFGLVAGVAFGAVAATADRARQTMISLGYSFVLAIIGWAGYSAIAGTAGAHPAAPLLFAQETLSSMAIGGLAALPIVLVPVRGMAGFAIWSWNRWIWASAYVIGLFGFFVVLMPKPFSWATVGLSVWTWIGLYVTYAITAVALWLAITRPWRTRAHDAIAARTSSTSPEVQAVDAAPGS